jgi:hypothetical protein
MLLSKLVYLSIKNAIYYDDSSFTYATFLEGKHDNNPQYATNINNIFTPINEAISRLSDLERIPYKVASFNFSSLSEGNILQVSNSKEVVSVAQMYGNDYRSLGFRPFGYGKIMITDYVSSDRPILVEYKEDIPQFDENDFDVELKDYGINDSVCNYLMEYAMAKLTEDQAPEIANMHLTRAEQYFSNIKANTSAFPQNQVEVKFGIL